ncbi:MAG: TIGR03936 family radical SAM-associated protein [Chloroflexota bacterium]|nr:TIGR03936 family radical SAM-associated protein [Chloroflexota bacterium]
MSQEASKTETGDMPTQQRLRITYKKDDCLKYVGHLDFARTWERALRRADLPLAYSQGFNPQAKLQFASALPIGATGRHELLDIILNESMAPEDFVTKVAPQLPAGLTLIEVSEAPLKTKALQNLLRSTEWQVDLRTDLSEEEIRDAIDRVLQATELPSTRRRKGKTVHYDLRPLILALSYDGAPESDWHRLSMILRSEPGATGRPDSVLRSLGLEESSHRLDRMRLSFAEPPELADS